MHNANTKIRWTLLLGCVVVALAFVLIPALHIQPFRAQTAAGLDWSYQLKSWSPWATLLALLAALWLTWQLWRARPGVMRKLVLCVLLVPAIAAAWFARQNHFEWMFAPISSIAYASANEATFLNDNDVVMAITLNGETAAYPVRQMAYHHVVNDVVGGRPITATY
jgi:hypothetical protein